MQWLLPYLLIAADPTPLPPPPAAIAPFFAPPKEFANDLGPYRSPMTFADGSTAKTPADWTRRRQEILGTWHGFMGAWPPVLDRPKVDVLDTERRDGLTQHKLRVEVAAGVTTDDALLLVPDGRGPFPAVVVVFYDAATGVGRGTRGPLRDFALQLARRGFVALSLGRDPFTYLPTKETLTVQPLSFRAYEAANCYHVLANRPDVDASRIGVVGHSYGGKWAMFASCLYDRFACGAWSDGGVVFDESRPNVNYWEPWYLGFERGRERKRGVIAADNPRMGPYARMVADGRDLHELHALMAPRPFLVSGGSEDQPNRWKALNHAIAVNRLLGATNRVAMTNRDGHNPTEESNAQMYTFLEWALRR
ncbi:MAG: sialidase [Gemmataceae bacterium]